MKGTNMSDIIITGFNSLIGVREFIDGHYNSMSEARAVAHKHFCEHPYFMNYTYFENKQKEFKWLHEHYPLSKTAFREYMHNNKVYLINSSVITSDGLYSLDTIGAVQFVSELKETDFISTIGYQETADLVADMIGKPVPVSREQITMKTGDVAYVVKLKYRINDPKTKGQVSYSSMDYQFQKMVKVG